MNNDFLIWAMSEAQKSHPCLYYRLEVPLYSIDDLGYAKVNLNYRLAPHSSGDKIIEKLMYSDIYLMYNGANEKNNLTYKVLKSKKPAKDSEDKLRVPPAIIYDADDNIDFVHPFNAAAYVVHGTRSYPDAKLLEPGDTIMYENHNGKIDVLWDDKITEYSGAVFDIKNNLSRMVERNNMIKGADAATCPSPVLASYWKNVIGQNHVYVYPNTVNLEDYEFYDVKRRDDKIRILWQGGDSHYIDWWPLRGALKTISEKYRDKITFVMYGAQYDWLSSIIPDNMMEKHSWTPYASYQLKRGLLNIDINLCPLVDNIFNRCKSAIKWYEGSIWNEPEATLAQKTGPYLEIEHNETGLLFSTPDEFVEMLSSLIDNADLRKKLGRGAKQWVLDNRTPEKTTPGLFDFYLETRARQKRDLGLSPIKLISTA